MPQARPRRFAEAARLVQLARLPRLRLAAGAPLVDFRAKRVDQLPVVPRLLHKIAHATAHRFNRQIDRAPSGHDDDRQEVVLLLDARQQIDPLTARRRVSRVVQIHQEKVVRAARDGIDHGIGRGDGIHADAFPFEQETQCVEQIVLVVGDEDARVNGARGNHDGPRLSKRRATPDSRRFSRQLLEKGILAAARHP
jgi:hypothetical protein